MRLSVMAKRVRTRVKEHRAQEVEAMIAARVSWSETACKRNWLVRWFCGLPAKPLTHEQARADLSRGEHLSGIILTSPIEMMRWQGAEALRICSALETAECEGLPLKLSSAEVRELRRWL